MAISDAFVKVECDLCGEVEEVPLGCTARGGYYSSDSEIEEYVENLGWKVTDDQYICEVCIEESADREEDVQNESKPFGWE